MARTTINVPFRCNFSEAEKTINSILLNNGFHQTTLNSGENVWKKGTGLMTAMQFVKVEFSSGEAVLSAWVQAGIGSLGGSEMDLTGIVAAIPKKSLMKVLSQIKSAL